MKLVSRRAYLMGAVGTLAAGAGIGLAWYQLRAGTSVPVEAENDFWALSLQDPAGQALAMKTFKGRPLLLNFWATWCPPCIEELPLLSKFYQENKAKGWQVLGIAVDQPSSVRRFMDQTPLSFPVVMGGTTGISLSQSLGNRQGGLPFSVLFNSQGKVLRHTIGKLSPGDLAAWQQAV